jgi:hypothetical protein
VPANQCHHGTNKSQVYGDGVSVCASAAVEEADSKPLVTKAEGLAALHRPFVNFGSVPIGVTDISDERPFATTVWESEAVSRIAGFFISGQQRSRSIGLNNLAKMPVIDEEYISDQSSATSPAGMVLTLQ